MRTSTGPPASDVALHQRDVLGIVDVVDVDHHAELAAVAAVELGLQRAARRCARGAGDRRSGRRWCRSSGRGAGRRSTRSGSRAMVPSSFMISQITPAGLRPGQARDVDRRLGMAGAHQHAAVARPPAGRRGPGVTMSCGPCVGSMATATVRARSAAEMPVVTPSRASIETVKAVWWRVPLFVRHQRQAELLDPLARSAPGRSGRAPCLAMKLIASGVAHLRRDDEVALVLAVLVVDQDEHPAVAGVLDDVLERRHSPREGDPPGVPARAPRHAWVRVQQSRNVSRQHVDFQVDPRRPAGAEIRLRPG